VAFSALLDACVLYPVGVRDVLLSVADREVYAPRWSAEILNEMSRNVLNHGRSTPEKIAAMCAAMNRAFPAAMIEGYGHLVSAMTNDVGDRHVLAAAVRGNVGLIVTNNLRHFPDSACQPYEIEVQSADEFLSYALDQDGTAVIDALRAMVEKRTSPPLTIAETLDQLQRTLPVFSKEVQTLVRQPGRN
jgi:hypothetical protein